MDRETPNKRINAGNFVETNGSIMRTLNVLATKYSRLKDNVTINEIWYCGKCYLTSKTQKTDKQNAKFFLEYL